MKAVATELEREEFGNWKGLESEVEGGETTGGRRVSRNDHGGREP